jgi:hypothetical protein
MVDTRRRIQVSRKFTVFEVEKLLELQQTLEKDIGLKPHKRLQVELLPVLLPRLRQRDKSAESVIMNDNNPTEETDGMDDGWMFV